MRKRSPLSLLAIAIMLCLVSCSSPERTAEKAAIKANTCCSDYFKELEKCEEDFCASFDAGKYANRKEAIQDYRARKEKVYETYEQKMNEAQEAFNKGLNSFGRDYKEKSQYLQSYYASLDMDRLSEVEASAKDTVLPDAVRMAVRSIMPSKPNLQQIQQDLIGHSLSEGLEPDECWFSKDWRWNIEEGEVHDLHITETLRDTRDEYSFMADMVLQGEYTSFRASAQITYKLPEDEDWKIDYILSKGLRIIPTHKFDNILQFSIEDDGWGGVNALKIHNPSEIELVAFGFFYAYNEWHRFVAIIPPGETKQVGGTFCGGNVTNYKIAYVERH